MSTLKVGTISNTAGTLSISADRVAQGTAAAWVNFNGTGTVAIRASFNVSSITDNGTGDYTVNFTTAMPDANYSITGLSRQSGAASFLNPYDDGTPRTTSACRIQAFYGSGTSFTTGDAHWINVAIFR